MPRRRVHFSDAEAGFPYPASGWKLLARHSAETLSGTRVTMIGFTPLPIANGVHARRCEAER